MFVEGLPGVPDNISPRLLGGYWVAFAATRHSGLHDFMGRNAWIRNIIVKVLKMLLSLHYKLSCSLA